VGLKPLGWRGQSQAFEDRVRESLWGELGAPTVYSVKTDLAPPVDEAQLETAFNKASWDVGRRKSRFFPGVVAHACNPSYSGGGDGEDSNSKVVRAKVSKTPSHQNLGVVAHACHPSYVGGIGRRIIV
jgi:hypothetical protein